MNTNTIYNEPCLETLKKMPNEFLDCVITSPPYWQLRDYGYEGQWGLEPTFQEYLEHLWEMMDEIYRVLKPSGTVWINLGDTYARGSRKKDANNDSLRHTNNKVEPNTKPEYNGLDKCLLLIPHRFAIGCIERGWVMRNDIIWAKRNGMPESVKDRFTKKHEYIFFMTKSTDYYFDLDSIRDKVKDESLKRYQYSFTGNKNSVERDMIGYTSGDKTHLINQKGKNCGTVSDFWDITTKPNTDNHYASYNQDLIHKPIIAGCPENGLIYDPFMGTGSTAIAALRRNRNFIGSEMSVEYMKIAEKNLNNILKQNTLF